MSADPPTVDGRSVEELTALTAGLAAAYTGGEWEPGSADAGDAPSRGPNAGAGGGVSTRETDGGGEP